MSLECSKETFVEKGSEYVTDMLISKSKARETRDLEEDVPRRDVACGRCFEARPVAPSSVG